MDKSNSSNLCKGAAGGFSFGQPFAVKRDEPRVNVGFGQTFGMPRCENLRDITDYKARLATFERWPPAMPITALELCHAGF